MEPDKTYTIAGRQYVIKNLTIDESEEVLKITSKVKLDEKEWTADYTNEDAKRFLEIVLKPVDNNPVDKSVFGQALEKDFLEIFLTFFLMRLISARNSASQFAKSISGLMKLSANSEA